MRAYCISGFVSTTTLVFQDLSIEISGRSSANSVLSFSEIASKFIDFRMTQAAVKVPRTWFQN